MTISEKNKSASDIENKIQEIEDELKFMSSIDIEMFREKIGKRWKITAEIYFRFNSNKFPSPN